MTARESTAGTTEEEKPNVLKSFADLFRNRKFWLTGLANAFYNTTMALVLAKFMTQFEKEIRANVE